MHYIIRHYMGQTRIQYIDLGVGIMILWMVVYHALLCAWHIEMDFSSMPALYQIIPQTTYTFIDELGEKKIINPCLLFPYLCFFMPFFFYKSGIFHRKVGWKYLLKKDTRKLLLNYLVWGGIGFIILIFLRLFDCTTTFKGFLFSTIGDIVLYGKAPLNAPLWFLLSLFGVHLIANLLLPGEDFNLKHPHVFHFYCLTIILIGCALSYFLYIRAYTDSPIRVSRQPYWIANITSGFTFYSMGYWVDKYSNKIWLYIPSVFFYSICCCVGFTIVDMCPNKLLQGNYLLWFPISLVSIITFNALCKLIIVLREQVSQLLHIKSSIFFFEAIGKNAMTIYVSHFILLKIYSYIARYFHITHVPHQLIAITLMLLLVISILSYNTLHKKHVSLNKNNQRQAFILPTEINYNR